MNTTEHTMRLPIHIHCLRLAPLVALVLVGCGVGESQGANMGDCAFGIGAQAWVDADADGTWGATEAPLAGATLVTSQLPDGPLRVRSAPSDATGRTDVSFPVVCWAREVPAVMEAPPGYTPTTPQPVRVPIGQPGKSATVQFGFRPMS
jgi:hypothetical protein